MGIEYLIAAAALVAGAIGVRWFRRYRETQIAEEERTSDDSFLAGMPEVAATLATRVLEERQRVAKTLGVAAYRLKPSHTFEQLRRLRPRPLYLSVGWNDLQFELLERSQSRGTVSRERELTIADIIKISLGLEKL